MRTVLMLLLSLLPMGAELRHRAEIVEHNGFYDEHGKHVFDQLIVWDETPDVIDWRLIHGRELTRPRPGLLLWWDARTGMHAIRYRTWRRSWTQHDPELLNREFLPRELRPGLGKPAPP